jgi:hypothetical protein
MKKIHLVETIQSFLSSDNAGDSKGMYHPEEIKIHLSNVFNQSVYNAWLNGKRYSDFSQLDAWSKTYEVDVLNQCGDRAYCLLPFAPVQLPDGMGIRQLRTHWACPVYGAGIGTEWTFAPIEATANAIFDELEVSEMDDIPTYRLEQSNVNVGAGEKSHMLWLEKLPIPPETLITTVDILMIVPIESLDDYDDVVLPTGSEDSLVRQVVDIMSRKPKSDTSTDMVNANPVQ